MAINNWFAVDKEGLRKLIEHRGKVFLIYELASNGFDAKSSLLTITLIPLNRGKYELTVIDDSPDGFKNITHAYTLYADSEKKLDPKQRGRFNIGEKLVLALCEEAQIISIDSGVIFNKNGERRATSKRTITGTVFTGILKMTQAAYQEVEQKVHFLIPPSKTTVTFNGVTIEHCDVVRSFDATLPTVISDKEGVLRSTKRMTKVEISRVLHNETGMLYEMGIPVVETEIQFHVNIMQKIPLNQDRDNVTPSFNRLISTEVLNHTHDLLTEDQSTKTWVNVALENEHVSVTAVKDVIAKRFGAKVVAYDPSDKEANTKASMNGYHVLGGRSFNSDQWNNIRKSESAPPAGRVFATAKPYSDDPNASPVDVVDPAAYTHGIKAVVALARELARTVLGVPALNVTVVRTSNAFSACYSKPLGLDLNLRLLGHAWFNAILESKYENIIALFAHEFAHHYESNHGSENFYRQIEKLAGKFCQLALTKPETFNVK